MGDTLVKAMKDRTVESIDKALKQTESDIKTLSDGIQQVSRDKQIQSVFQRKYEKLVTLCGDSHQLKDLIEKEMILIKEIASILNNNNNELIHNKVTKLEIKVDQARELKLMEREMYTQVLLQAEEFITQFQQQIDKLQQLLKQMVTKIDNVENNAKVQGTTAHFLSETECVDLVNEMVNTIEQCESVHLREIKVKNYNNDAIKNGINNLNIIKQFLEKLNNENRMCEDIINVQNNSGWKYAANTGQNVNTNVDYECLEKWMIDVNPDIAVTMRLKCLIQVTKNLIVLRQMFKSVLSLSNENVEARREDWNKLMEQIKIFGEVGGYTNNKYELVSVQEDTYTSSGMKTVVEQMMKQNKELVAMEQAYKDFCNNSNSNGNNVNRNDGKDIDNDNDNDIGNREASNINPGENGSQDSDSKEKMMQDNDNENDNGLDPDEDIVDGDVKSDSPAMCNPTDIDFECQPQDNDNTAPVSDANKVARKSSMLESPILNGKRVTSRAQATAAFAQSLKAVLESIETSGISNWSLTDVTTQNINQMMVNLFDMMYWSQFDCNDNNRNNADNINTSIAADKIRLNLLTTMLPRAHDDMMVDNQDDGDGKDNDEDEDVNERLCPQFENQFDELENVLKQWQTDKNIVDIQETVQREVNELDVREYQDKIEKTVENENKIESENSDIMPQISTQVMRWRKDLTKWKSKIETSQEKHNQIENNLNIAQNKTKQTETKLREMYDTHNKEIAKRNNIYLEKVNSQRDIKGLNQELNQIGNNRQRLQQLKTAYRQFKKDNENDVKQLKIKYKDRWELFESVWYKEWDASDIILYLKYKFGYLDNINNDNETAIKYKVIDFDLMQEKMSRMEYDNGKHLPEIGSQRLKTFGIKSSRLRKQIIKIFDQLCTKYPDTSDETDSESDDDDNDAKDNNNGDGDDDLNNGEEVLKTNVDERYICPLSGNVMKQPVIAGDGKTYDKNSIIEYWETHGKYPCGMIVDEIDQEIEDLEPNDKLAREINMKKLNL